MNAQELYNDLLEVKSLKKFLTTSIYAVLVPLLVCLLIMGYYMYWDLADLRNSVVTKQQLESLELSLGDHIESQNKSFTYRLNDQDDLIKSQQIELRDKMDAVIERITNLEADASDFKKMILHITGTNMLDKKEIKNILVRSFSGLCADVKKFCGGRGEDIKQPTRYYSVKSDADKDVPVYYFVQVGDTLFSISQRFGVPLEDIVRINKLHSNTIYVNQKLILENHGAARNNF